MRYGFLGFLMLLSAASGCGITAPTGNEGFADLDSLGFRDVDQTMSLSIGPTLLRIAAANIEDDPEAEMLVRRLDGVRIRTYDVVGDKERVAGRIDVMSRKLQAQGWIPVVLVREPGQRTALLMRLHDEHIAGLTLFNTDAREAVVVNIMGELQPEMFSAAMDAMEVDVPDFQAARAER